MQYAKCTTDGEVWEASKFALLEESQIEEKRKSLICVECGEFAWFRKESRHGHPPHFCAHHKDCDLKADYIISDEQRGDISEAVDQIKAGDAIIVRLDEEQGGEIDVEAVPQPPVDEEGKGGRAHIIKDKGKESSQQFTLRKILFRLVQSPDFRSSDKEIVFYKNPHEVMIRGKVKDVVTRFDKISKDVHHGKLMFYWGPIASAKKSEDGKIWLNSSTSYRSASIAIFDDVADQFMDYFNVDDFEDLAGAYVLVAGKCYFTGGGEGKPVIWCGTPKYIAMRKYRAEYLQADV